VQKKKFRDCFSYDEYWMGIAFLIAAKFKSKNVIIVVKDNQLVYINKEKLLCSSLEYEHYQQPDIDIVANCKDLSMCVVYCTFTPDYHVISNLASTNLKKIIFYKNENLCEVSQDFIDCFQNIALIPFSGNLNWMKDYISILESFGIFN
jgi:hypothetical protein